MAKGQKRSNREAKKPKQPKVKPIVAASSVAMARAQTTSPPAKKG
jgi:hypothetical protein